MGERGARQRRPRAPLRPSPARLEGPAPRRAGVACRLTDDRPVRIVHAAPSRGVVADSMAAYGRIGEVISIGRAEIAFALALLSQVLPTSTLCTAIHRRAIMRATK